MVDTAAPLYLPASAKVGSSGTLNGATVYEDETKVKAIKQKSRGWSLEADTATTALLCLNDVTFDLIDHVQYAEYDCYRINTSGVLLGMQIKLVAPDGQVTTFK